MTGNYGPFIRNTLSSMSEYWKSTPKYWCKFCKAFVRDTPQEKKQHDSTPKHQNNIQRSLRELHKGQERDERDKQRAKDEVARVNGIVERRSGSSGSSLKAAPPAFSAHAKATPDDRKRQMEQLAAMGIAVPQDFRKDLSIGGDWTVVSETPVYSTSDMKNEDGEAKGAFGVRKRKLDEEEEEAAAVAAAPVRRNWGSTLKSYPGSKGEEADLDVLLSGATVKKEPAQPRGLDRDGQGLKKEESVEEPLALASVPDVNQPTVAVKQEEETAAPPVVFKKRKGVKR